MDRSYLSHPEVVEASRQFICARLATYEDAAEAEFLTSVFPGPSGDLQNTVFAILDPEGKRNLVRSGRSPHWAFRTPETMATEMKKIADRYDVEGEPKAAELGMPYLADARLALNVAACDAQRLAIVRGTAEQRAKLEKTLVDIAWSEDLRGKLLWVPADADEDLPEFEGKVPSHGITVVEPHAYGTSGKVVTSIKTTKSKDMTKALAKAAADSELGTTDSRSHIRNARRDGVHWETAVPVTDGHGRGKKR